MLAMSGHPARGAKQGKFPEADNSIGREGGSRT